MEQTDESRGLFDGFEGYRTPGSEHLEHVLRHGMVALDTNVLLDLYRYGDLARREFFDVLESVRDSLFIPSQVVIEFWRNRDGVLAEEIGLSAKQRLSSARSTIQSVVNEWGKRTQATDQAASLLIRVETVLDEAEEEMRQASGRLDGRGALADTTRDPVLAGLERVLEGRIGDPLDATQRDELIQRGEARFAEEIPPGYLDAKKHGLTEAGTGDYLVWEQLIAQASRISRDVLFITRDEKPDWWRQDYAGRLLGPRVELVSEIRERAGVSYFMLRPAQFLKAATELLHVEVSERTIDDASRISEPNQQLEWAEKWTASTVDMLLTKLDASGAWVQAAVIRKAATDADGFISRARVYEIAEYEPGRQLKGFTRPVRGVLEEMIALGEVSEDIDPPMAAVYSAPGKADGFQVPPSIVRALAPVGANSQLTWVDAACEVMRGSGEWWHPREIVAAVEERGLRDLSDAKTPEHTLRRDLALRASDIFERDGSRFRLMAD